jgi:hypothetical protein
VSGPWISTRLQTEAPVALGGTLSLVGQVRAEAWNLYQLGSAILVRPDVALTAAHVVTFSKEGKTWVAGRISVDIGRARVWAQALAVQRPWLESAAGACEVV